jgi:hypothetical protein
MPVKCVTCDLLFRTGNDLDWHIREEHLKKKTPPAKRAPVAAPAPVVGGTDQADGPPPRADGGREPAPTAVEPPARRGGAGCSAGGHRNPHRGRVAEGPSARSVPPGRVRARPAAQAGEVRPAGAVRPRSLQASRCAPRSRGRWCRRRHAGAACAGSFAAPPNSQSGTNGSTNMASSAARPTQGVGMSGVSPPLGQGTGLLLLPRDVCGMGHCRHVVDHHSWWLVSRVRISDTAELGPWL